ncbi:unnamed protein product [Musa textilis]
MFGCKHVATPIDLNHKLRCSSQRATVEAIKYQRLVGKLIYLSHTRLYLTFAVSVVNQFIHSPYEEHLETVYRILRYLKKTPDKCLLFKKDNHMRIEAFTNADWVGSVSDRRSTSRYCIFVGDNLVTWRSKMEAVVARSSVEAEFKEVTQGICELLWLKMLLKELRIPTETPIRLYIR